MQKTAHRRRGGKPWLLAAGLVAALALAPSASATRAGPEAAFLAENDKAMQRMMAGMAIRPTGDIDQDFVSMMEPHHQGAIAMAQAELRHGRNEALRRIAQEIVVEQQQEIVAMRLATGRPLPAAAATPDQQHLIPDASAGAPRP